MDILDIIIHLGGAIWVFFFGVMLILLRDKSGQIDVTPVISLIFGIILCLYAISLALEIFEELGFII